MPEISSNPSNKSSKHSLELILKLELKELNESQETEGSEWVLCTKTCASEFTRREHDAEPDNDSSVPQSHEFKGTLGDYEFTLILEKLKHVDKP